MTARVARPERIGVLGGTFDPPHIGHLAAAVNVRAALGLDRVLLVVANDPWQKRGTRTISAARHRLAMVEAAVEGLEGIEADDREIRRGGASLTVDTLAELRAEHPGCVLFVVVGADAAQLVDTWKSPRVLSESANFAVVSRPGVAAGPRPAGFRWVDVEVPALEVSSTDLRARVAARRPIDVLTTGAVRSWIAEHRLYSVDR